MMDRAQLKPLTSKPERIRRNERGIMSRPRVQINKSDQSHALLAHLYQHLQQFKELSGVLAITGTYN